MRRDPLCVVGLIFCLALLMDAPALAGPNSPEDQSGGQTVSSSPSPDFFLGRPRASLGFRGNWFLASAKSDIYDFVTEHLTLQRSSFNTPTIGGELSVNVSPRIDVVAGFEFGKSTTPSEYRKFIDNKGLPIEQQTSLEQTDVTASVRYSLIPKGRSISRLAWIPRTVTPYVGAGAGLMRYELLQTGDFVDFQTNRVFGDVFQSDGWARSAHLLGGADIQVYKHFFMSFEGRYVWSSATLSQKFVDFEPIDLGGARFGAGVHVVF
ncbi:MAG: hypothetical protein ACRD2N_27075 [Vicinamibacterales bacterium]